MPGHVRGKLESVKAKDPLGREGAEDPWADFRDVEILDLRLEFQFRHSLGKVSRFFLALEERRLLATRCPTCHTVWIPPRAVCGNDLAVTQWTELSGRGTLAVGSVSAYSLTSADANTQLMFGYIALDGASTLLFHQLRKVEPDALVAGLPVKAVWGDSPVDHPMRLFWFEPA